MSVPEITVVLVAWNSGDSLETCIASLCGSAREASVALNLVIIDNDSSDDSIERLTLLNGDRLVRNPMNAGFGIAAMQGMALASAPWVLLVNPDVVVERRFVAEIAHAAAEASSRVATIIPELRFASERGLVNCRGVTMDTAGLPSEVDAGQPHTLPSQPSAALGGSSGCCLIRREALVALGGIEPCFFAYLEDVDLAVRLRRSGYDATLVPSAIAWHQGSASTVEGSPLKTYLVARNRRILFRLDAPRTLRARLWRTLAEAGHSVVATRDGGGDAPWRGRLAALCQRRYVRYVRRSRMLFDPPARAVTLAQRTTLRDTLARKRALQRALASSRHRLDRPGSDSNI
jgi:GT2 family glycosyltransferase